MKTRKRADGSSALIADDHFSRWHIESWIIRRLAARLGVTELSLDAIVSEGTTTFEIRRDRIQHFIVEHSLGAEIIGGEKIGKPETYAEVFHRFYGQRLESQPIGAKQ